MLWVLKLQIKPGEIEGKSCCSVRWMGERRGGHEGEWCPWVSVWRRLCSCGLLSSFSHFEWIPRWNTNVWLCLCLDLWIVGIEDVWLYPSSLKAFSHLKVHGIHLIRLVLLSHCNYVSTWKTLHDIPTPCHHHLHGLQLSILVIDWCVDDCVSDVSMLSIRWLAFHHYLI